MVETAVTYRNTLCSDEDWNTLTAEREAFHAGMLSGGDYTRITKSSPGFEQSFDDRMWNLMSNALVAFLNETGREPSPTSDDVQERMLAEFLEVQRESEHPARVAQEIREKSVEHPTERDGLPMLWLLGRWTERTSVSVETHMRTGYSRIPGNSASAKNFAYIEAWSKDVEPHLGATVFLYDRSTGEATKVVLVPGSLAPIERMVVRVEYRAVQKPIRCVRRKVQP